MTLRFYLTALRREARGSAGRLNFFVACLAVGVAAVVAVAGLSSGLDQGLRTEARALLAADLAVEGRRPAPPELDEALDDLRRRGIEIHRTEIREMATVVAARGGEGGTPGRSQLVELKVVEGAYPFYGRLELEPDRPLGELLMPETAVVSPDLLPRLGLAAGDTLRVGGAEFRIAGTVRAEPDRVRFGLTLGPRVFLSAAGLERAGLVRKGSRVDYRTLLRVRRGAGGDLPAEDLRRIARELGERLPAYHRVETWEEAQPSVRSGLRRMDRFLGLVALLSLLVGGVGVAQTVRAWVAGRMTSIAVLKCLGLRPREVMALYLGQALLLGLLGSLAGALAGVGALALLPEIFPRLVPRALLDPWQPAAVLRGLGLGVGVALVFSAPPLAGVWRVPPARVLRRDAEPLPPGRGATGLAAATLVLGTLGMATLQSRSLALGAGFAGGLAALTLVLTAAALGLTRVAAKLRTAGATSASGGRISQPLRPVWVYVRHGLAALGRPGAATLGAVVSLGLGVLVVLAVAVVEHQLADQLTAQLPEEAPSVFLVDIQPHQWPGVRQLLEREGAEGLDSQPVVMARLTSIDGAGAQDLARGAGREKRERRWALTREQRLTWYEGEPGREEAPGERLPAGNRVVAGQLWSLPDAAEVSVEEEFAGELGVGVGSRLGLDVQGVPLQLTVTSVRTVDWGTFGLNFFLVVEPGVLEEAPHQRVATVRLPPERVQEVQDLMAATFPNVTYLPVRAILDKIVAVLEKLGLGVRFLGGFTVLAGVVILAGAVAAAAARRNREVALLKTLGMTRRGVAVMFAVELALVGLLAGTLGAAGAALLSWAVLTHGLELEWSFRAGPYLVAVAGTAALSVLAGLAASSRSLTRRPLEVLRSE